MRELHFSCFATKMSFLCGALWVLLATQQGSYAAEGTPEAFRRNFEKDTPRKSAYSVWIEQSDEDKASHGSLFSDPQPFSSGRKALGVSELARILEITNLFLIKLDVLDTHLPAQLPAVGELRGWLHALDAQVPVRQPPLILVDSDVPVVVPQHEAKASLKAAVCETIRRQRSGFEVPDLLIAWQPMGLALVECFKDILSPRVSRSLLVLPSGADESWNLVELARRADLLLFKTDVPGSRGVVVMGEGWAPWFRVAQSHRPDEWHRQLLGHLVAARDLTGDFSSRDCRRERRLSCFKTALQQQVGLEMQPDSPLILGVLEETKQSMPSEALPQILLEALTRVEADHGIKAQALILVCGEMAEVELTGGQLERLARTFSDRIRVLKAKAKGKASRAACGRAFQSASRGADVVIDLSSHPNPSRLFATVYGGAFPLIFSQNWLFADFGHSLGAEMLTLDEVFVGTSSVPDLYPQIRLAANALQRILVLFSSRASADHALQVKQQLLLTWLGAVLAVGDDNGKSVIESWAQGFDPK